MSKIDICGHKYDVLLVSNTHEEMEEDDVTCLGKSDIATFTIYINKDVPKTLQEETLLHELIHTIWSHNNEKMDHSESLINATSNGLYQLGLGKVLADKYLTPKETE